MAQVFNTYEPKTWASREFILKNSMNHIEQGIYNNSLAIENINTKLSDIEDQIANARTAGKHVYGIKFDGVNSQCERLWDAANITTDTTNFCHHGTINENLDNPFDDIYPWSEFKFCVADLDLYQNLSPINDIRDCVVLWEGYPNIMPPSYYETTNENYFYGRYTPEYWYIGYYDEELECQVYGIADSYMPGWGHSPAAIDSYSFLTRNKSRTAICLPDKEPLTGRSLGTIAEYGRVRGIHTQDIYTYSARLTALIVEYANMNIQEVLGKGVTELYYGFDNNTPIESLIAEENATRIVVSEQFKEYAIPGAIIAISDGSDNVEQYPHVICQGYRYYENGDTASISINIDEPYSTYVGMKIGILGAVNPNPSQFLGDNYKFIGSGYIGENGKTPVFYRGAEMYGNKWHFITGVEINSVVEDEGTDELHGVEVCPAREQCDDWQGWNYIGDPIDFTLPTENGYIQSLGVLPNFRLGALPFATTIQGNSKNPVGDYYYAPNFPENNERHILLVGGTANSKDRSGPFYGGWHQTTHVSGHLYGSYGVLYLPQAEPYPTAE